MIRYPNRRGVIMVYYIGEGMGENHSYIVYLTGVGEATVSDMVMERRLI